MPVLQYYYTSFVNPTTRSAGFQCKAGSPHLTEAHQTLLKRLLAYRIPPTLDERALDQHPIALRFFRNEEVCALLCCQSTGSDGSGRPGNFFAHAVDVSPDELANTPPIAYWRNAMWRTDDPPGNSTVAEPVHLEPAEPPSIEQVGEFLDQADRRSWFSALLAAVVHSGPASRPIVILDSADNVAQWVAAVTLALPSGHRNLLTFATYHHDPYQAPYTITGTTADSVFQFNATEYLSYFVMNPRDNRISECQSSDYAEFVAQRLTPVAYTDELVPFLAFVGRRLPHPTAIDLRLDSVTHLRQLIERTQWTEIHTRDTEAFDLALDGLEQAGPLADPDIWDLVAINTAIREAVAAEPCEAILRTFARATKLARAFDPNYTLYLADDLRFLVELVVRDCQSEAKLLAHTLDAAYGQVALVAAANTPEFLARLVEVASERDAWLPLWINLGGYLEFDSGSQPVLDSTLARIERYAGGGGPAIPVAAGLLVNAVLAARPGASQALLEYAVERAQSYPGALRWIYGTLVAQLPLAARRELRQIVHRADPTIFLYEFERQLQAAPSVTGADVLDPWLEELDREEDRSTLVTTWLRIAWQPLPGAQRRAQAQQLLSRADRIALLQPTDEQRVVDSAFGGTTLHFPTEQENNLFSIYVDSPALQPELRDTLRLCMAIAHGDFEDPNGSLLHKRLSAATAAEYRLQLEQMLPRYLHPRSAISTYANAVRSLYVLHHQAIFWQVHWQVFCSLFDGPDPRPVATWLFEFLDFWFEQSPTQLGRQPYVVPQFFLGISSAIATIQDAGLWKQAGPVAQAMASEAPWSGIARDWFGPGKSRFARFLGR